jgi:hypothetical protein
MIADMEAAYQHLTTEPRPANLTSAQERKPKPKTKPR